MCILWPRADGIVQARHLKKIDYTKMQEWVSERYIVMTDGCF